MRSSVFTPQQYLSGLQCHRRLWLDAHGPRDQDAGEDDFAAHLRQTLRSGAQHVFAGGIDVFPASKTMADAMALTSQLVHDQKIPAVFNAVFCTEDMRCQIDVLSRRPGGRWAMAEIKGSTSVKPHHIDTAAVKAYGLTKLGVNVESVTMLHVNTEYRLSADGIVWPDFFAQSDITEPVQSRISEVSANLDQMRDVLNCVEAPHIEPGIHCGVPYNCAHFEDCTDGKPDDWVKQLPRFGQTKIDELKARGIEAISAIPADFQLTAQQAKIRDVQVSGRPFIAPGLAGWLRQFGPPACYLDFEAMAAMLPLYQGARPYETIPFQWSLHILDANGALHHHEYLAEGRQDPRREFAETLITALTPSDMPIIVYSSYERTQLRELANMFPDLKTQLDSLISRLADLLPIVRDGVYFASFGGSFSIKAVGPALCPEFTYDDLEEIADGLSAAEGFLQIASGFITEARDIASKRAALLAYCKRDTLAMVEVHKALCKLAAHGQAL